MATSADEFSGSNAAASAAVTWAQAEEMFPGCSAEWDAAGPADPTDWELRLVVGTEPEATARLVAYNTAEFGHLRYEGGRWVDPSDEPMDRDLDVPEGLRQRILEMAGLRPGPRERREDADDEELQEQLRAIGATGLARATSDERRLARLRAELDGEGT